MVGSVHDQTGRPVLDGVVTAFGPDGGVVGRGVTGPDGTFAVAVDRPAASIQVTCRHCAALRARAGDASLALIVTRFRALEQRGELDETDLAALPYRDPVQAAALIPYAFTISSGQEIISLSDRGLERGRGLVLDGGAPVYDIATGDQGLFGFPGRALGAIDRFDSGRAFEYGSYAGGGTFALDRLPDQIGTLGAVDEGGGSALALATRAGPFLPAVAESFDDGGIARRRADLDFASDFAGGFLRVETSLASQNSPDLGIAADRSRELATVAYVTESRRYRTSFGADAFSELGDELSYTNPWPYQTNSSAFDVNFRLEHPAPTTLAFGAVARTAAGAYSSLGLPPGAAHYDDELAYVEAAHDGRLSYDLGLSAARVAATVGYGGGNADALVLLPSATLGASLGDGFQLRLAASSSLRSPTIGELASSGSLYPAFSLERGSVYEADLAYDDGHRLQLDGTVFHENESGLNLRSLQGIGFGATWQVTPRLSLRAWTLHDTVPFDQPAMQLVPYADSLGPSFGRGVLWASYEAPGGLRFDAIARREFGVAGDVTDLDADAVAPLAGGFALTAGTARRENVRYSYVGLRFPHV